MRKPLPFLTPGRMGVLAALVVCLLGLPLSSFMSSHMTALGKPVSDGGRQASVFQDWSTRHLVYARYGPMAAMQAVAQDPRAAMAWWSATHQGGSGLEEEERQRGWPRRSERHSAMQHDWSIYLGTGGTAETMYPAKFSFNVTAAPSCANDYVVFSVNAAGSATQPNIVALNNLYSGTAGANGICNRTPSASDTGVAATVLWSYAIQGLGGGGSGAVATSPVIAFDPLGGSVTGTKVAIVESGAGSPAHFHVLAPKNGDGQNASNLQSVLSPKVINSFVSATPAIGSGTATNLSLGSSTSGTVTLSSPFIDYVRDLAYVGNDIGVLYRIKDVFCTSVNPDCSGGGTPAPSLDTSWGTGGSVTVCSGELTAPVLDFVTLNVYVGCSDGKLYSVSQTGTVKSLVVGDGVASKTYGAIVDPPVVDGVNGFVYAVSGSASSGANGALVQAKIDFSSSSTATIGTGNQCNIHAPVFSNAYYTAPTAAGALVYVGGVNGTLGVACTPSANPTGPTVELYGATFNGSTGVLNAGAPAHSWDLGGGPGFEWTALLEFDNTTTAIDWLFFSAAQSSQSNLASANITSGFPTAIGSLVTEGIGTSGMTVDNNSSSAQAASIYFNALLQNATCNNNTVVTDTGGCAVKLTQAALE